jgi:hypothetical protein
MISNRVRRTAAAFLVALALPAWAQKPQDTRQAAAPGTVPGPARAVGLYVFPQKGQDARKQNADEGQCYADARDRTGIDPETARPGPGAPTDARRTQRRSTVGGAGLGAGIGSAAGNAGAGAAIGGAAGLIRGRRQAQSEEAQSRNAAAAQHRQEVDAFKRAMTSCLEARGYSVK